MSTRTGARTASATRTSGEVENCFGLALGGEPAGVVDRCGRHLPLRCLELRLQLPCVRKRGRKLVEAFDHLAEMPVRVIGVRPPVDAVEIEEDAGTRGPDEFVNLARRVANVDVSRLCVGHVDRADA